MSSSEPLLSITHLKKYYEGHKAVEDVSFQLQRGATFGLLGPNGAGKTTLIRMITGIIYPDQGSIQFENQPFNARKDYSQMGYMPEERGLYKKMKVGDHLIYLARLKNLNKQEATHRALDWCNRLGLSNWWDKKVSDLSKGMQQKVQFIATIIHEPKLLILDEPFSGLDPINTNLIKKEIYHLCEKGTSVIFSTHRMEQVEEICEHIVLINQGKKLIDGKVQDIKTEFKKNEFSLQLNHPLRKEDMFSELFEIIAVEENNITLRLTQTVNNNTLLHFFMEKGYAIMSFHEILPSINEVFIDLVENNK